ncbi:F-box only protein 31-like isoform X2 [Ptychodera flava]|uniref:F-box only protein 31-like isoform X2 n=1 Tax=Ptychodera flava TaxID=63121 RepID=UPI00396A5A78
MASILMLPPELLAFLLSFLRGIDLSRVSLVCKRFKEAVDADWIWQQRCKREYGVESLNGWKSQSYRTFYTKILYHYGFIFGVWQADIEYYGGLVHVSVEDGLIVANQLVPACESNVQKPLQKKKLFSITLDDEDRVEIMCLKGHEGPHECIIQSTGEFESWLEEELDNVNDDLHEHIRDILQTKFEITRPYETKCLYKKMVLPLTIQDVPIQPGLFKGTYAANGVEIVNVSYHGDKMRVTKVTGDPHIPACEITIEADLNSQMVLTKHQQETRAQLEDLDVDDVIGGDENPELQPFIIPAGVSDRGLYYFEESKNIEQCRARYAGTGQLAAHGFQNSSSSPGHLIIFDEELFGFLWLELRTLSVFSRVLYRFD